MKDDNEFGEIRFDLEVLKEGNGDVVVVEVDFVVNSEIS